MSAAIRQQRRQTDGEAMVQCSLDSFRVLSLNFGGKWKKLAESRIPEIPTFRMYMSMSYLLLFVRYSLMKIGQIGPTFLVPGKWGKVIKKCVCAYTNVYGQIRDGGANLLAIFGNFWQCTATSTTTMSPCQPVSSYHLFICQSGSFLICQLVKELVPLKHLVKLRKEFSTNDTSRHPKLFKIGPQYGWQ